MWMKVWANVPKSATLRMTGCLANIRFVACWMVDNLLSRMCHGTVDAVTALVDHELRQPTSSVPNGDNVETHVRTVRMDFRVASEPAPADFDVSKTAKFVLVIVALGAPTGSE